MRSSLCVAAMAAASVLGSKMPKDIGYGPANPTKQKPEPYNMTEPEYSCADDSFTLHGNVCIRRLEEPPHPHCPPRFELDQNLTLCVRRLPVERICQRGEKREAANHTFECIDHIYSDPVEVCPLDYVFDRVNHRCVKLVDVELVAECVGGARKVENEKCVLINYAEPKYVCPSNSAQIGKKCKLETADVKVMRRLSAYDQHSDRRRQLHEMSRQHNNIIWAHGGENKVDFQTPWIPAGNGDEEFWQDKPKGHPPKLMKERLGHTKLKINVPVTKVVKEKGPKIVHEKAPKQKKAPQTQSVVKVKIFNADKVCEVGTLTDKLCVTQLFMPPEMKCPVDPFNGVNFNLTDRTCTKQLTQPVQLQCNATDSYIVCPPNVQGETCQCAIQVLNDAGKFCKDADDQMVLVDNVEICIRQERPRDECRGGFDYDPISRTCIRIETEEAVCTFIVNFLCVDCDVPKKYGHPHWNMLHGPPGPGPGVVPDYI